MEFEVPLDPAALLPPGASQLERLAAGVKAARDAAVDRLDAAFLAALENNWAHAARAGQLPPAGKWRTWLILAGRGFGKTRAGAEWVRSRAETDDRLRIALVAATLAEARAVMVEGESGLLAIGGARPPKFEASLRRLTWANGAQARGFRFRDPFDDSSNGMTDAATPLDVALGTGDGARTSFALVKPYGTTAPEARRITRPVTGSVRVAIDGIERASGWTLEAPGIVRFATAPASGVAVTAGFRFDVPVRFADDRLEVSVAAVTAGDAPEVALIEVREG